LQEKQKKPNVWERKKHRKIKLALAHFGGEATLFIYSEANGGPPLIYRQYTF
jgi:hypothetical protein